MEPLPDLVKRFAERFRDHPVSRFLDYHIVELAAGRCVMTLEFRPEFDNSTGAVHGGILSMLADTAVTATAQIIKTGGKVCVGTCDIHDPKGKLVATVIADFVRHGRR